MPKVKLEGSVDLGNLRLQHDDEASFGDFDSKAIRARLAIVETVFGQHSVDFSCRDYPRTCRCA